MKAEDAFGLALTLLLAAIGSYLFVRHPVSRWSCQATAGKVDCRVGHALLGVVPLRSQSFSGIADLRQRVERPRSSLRRGSTKVYPNEYLTVTTRDGTRHELPGRVSTVGSDNSQIVQAIRDLQAGRRHGFAAWQLDWLPTLLGGAFTGVPLLAFGVWAWSSVSARRRARAAAAREFFARAR